MSERDKARRKVLDSVDTKQMFDETETAIIEWNIDNIVKEARLGKYKRFTVDKAPLRTKYFFGEGYTYGGQLQERGAGNEKLYPRGEVDPIPDWMKELVIRPVEESGLVRSGWINSAVVNDYLPGGCIVSHIDPPHLFSRPIITVSFFSNSYLSFGCKFTFKPIRVSSPTARISVKRGWCLSMTGYAANEITHCIRPEDIQHRRAVIILRHVPESAPRMSRNDMEHFTLVEDRKKKERGKSLSPVLERRHSGRADNVLLLDHRKMRHRDRQRRETSRRSRSRSSGRRDRSRSPRYRRRSRSRSRPLRDRRRRSSSRDKRSRRSRSRTPTPRLRESLRSLRGISGVSSRTVDKALGSANKAVTVSKTVQDAILKNIIGHYNQDDDQDEEETSGDESVAEAVTKITETKELDQEEAAFHDRLAKMKKKITGEVRAGKHGDVKIEDEETILKNTFKEKEKIRKKKLEDEVQSLKDELKELKEHIKDKNSASSSSSSSSSSSFSHDDESDEEDRPVNILDIFKTTILEKSKTTKSTYRCKDSNNPSRMKSKLVESKTRKILKERIQMRKKSKM